MGLSSEHKKKCRFYNQRIKYGGVEDEKGLRWSFRDKGRVCLNQPNKVLAAGNLGMVKDEELIRYRGMGILAKTGQCRDRPNSQDLF